MAKPNECKWCGAKQLISPQLNMIYFGCWTGYDTSVDEWDQAKSCVERMAAQAKILRDRVRQALAVLKSVQRYDVEPYEDSVSHNYHYEGQQVDADCVDQVIRMLEGKSDD